MIQASAALLLAAAPSVAATGVAMNPLAVLDALPDLTAKLYAQAPSMGLNLSGPGDARIGRLARETGTPFKIALANFGRTAPSWILVDPTRRSGFLWLRSSTRVVVAAADLQAARDGKSPLSHDALAFLNRTAPATGAKEAPEASGR